ncbi:MAG: transposase [Chloroflexota bacterium]|nr:transposase [Chloroflexota bacterium]
MEEAGVEDTSGVVWQDEMRVGLIGQVRRVWVPKGEKIRQAVEVTYEWTYLNLAVDGVEGKIYWEWKPDMKQGSTVEFVESLEEEGVTGIVWDRAPCHRAKSVEAVGVPLVEQPAYSPELNPAERVFEEIRGEVKGEVYGELEKKEEAVERVLERLAADPEKIESLTGWDWIRENIEHFPLEQVAS